MLDDNQFNQSSRKVLASRSTNMMGSFMPGSMVRNSSQLSLPRIKSVPNIKLRNKAGSQKKLLKSRRGYNDSVPCETPRAMATPTDPASLVESLRRELCDAREGLVALDDMVDQNIVWVHSNCDTTFLGKISRSGQDKCKKIAAVRLVAMLEVSLQRCVYSALMHWREVLQSDKVRQIAKSFVLIKSIEIFSRAMGDCISRQLLKGWRPWFRLLQSQRNWEKEFAAVEIQRAARGMVVRLFLQVSHNYTRTVPHTCHNFTRNSPQTGRKNQEGCGCHSVLASQTVISQEDC